jgi:ParB family chromosome partitioning protein
MKKEAPEIKMIPVEHIRVVNPRARDKDKYAEIRDNIKSIGLKRPITVRVGEKRNGIQFYDLTCGQGRLEAFIHHQQKTIPSVVTHDSEHESLLKSLIENMARKRYSAREQFGAIQTLKTQGNSYTQIAEIVGLDAEFTRGICLLLENSEEKLLNAVVADKIPMYVAVQIAQLKDGDIQNAISDLYTQGKLTGKKVENAIKLIQMRRIGGKDYRHVAGGKRKKITAESIKAEFDREMEKQQAEYQELQLHKHHLRVLERLTSELIQDDHFVTLLRAEKLNQFPETLTKAVGFNG